MLLDLLRNELGLESKKHALAIIANNGDLSLLGLTKPREIVEKISENNNVSEEDRKKHTALLKERYEKYIKELLRGK